MECATIETPSDVRVVDLGVLLHEALWGVVEPVLDFICTGDLNICEVTIVKLFACAQVLQIRLLFEACREAFSSILTAVGAPQMVADVFFAFL